MSKFNLFALVLIARIAYHPGPDREKIIADIVVSAAVRSAHSQEAKDPYQKWNAELKKPGEKKEKLKFISNHIL